MDHALINNLLEELDKAAKFHHGYFGVEEDISELQYKTDTIIAVLTQYLESLKK